jgi:exonuclease III
MTVGKLEVIKKEMVRLSVDVLGISELKWKGTGNFPSDSHQVFFSGSEGTKKNGVAIITTHKAAQTVIGFNPLNERLLAIRFRGKPIHMTVIQVYAPTTTAKDSEVNEFYEGLQYLVDITPKGDTLVIMGDFNAKVGDKTLAGITGKFGLGEENEAGLRLKDFCQTNNLCIGNTMFQQPKR